MKNQKQSKEYFKDSSRLFDNNVLLSKGEKEGNRYYQFLTEGTNVCARCSALDGKKIKISDAKAGENLPPLHPNCRCEVVVLEASEGAYADPNNAYGLSESQKISNAEYIHRVLKEQGWSTQAIAALLGNIEKESGFNPAAYEVPGNKNRGYGLIQWTPATPFLSHFGINEVEADEMALNSPSILIDMQLEFLTLTSTTSCYDTRQWYPTMRFFSPYEMSFNSFITSTNCPRELASVFHSHYERSADSEDGIRGRADSAEKWFNYFNGR
ncbi:MAG: phage tail tip lysozyme [Oscillospiraceae bacterium]|nr:phage tail tip lysozyme [Oscillospiraceae bacterium]